MEALISTPTTPKGAWEAEERQRQDDVEAPAGSETRETERPCLTKGERRQPWNLPSALHLCAVAYAHVYKMTQINMKKKKQIIL